jgi:hypothetical protein
MSSYQREHSTPISNEIWKSACLPRATETAPTVIPSTPKEKEPITVPAPPPLRKPKPEEKPTTVPESDPCRRYSTCEF